MEMLTAIYLVGAVIGVSMAIWLNTKSGKRWMENL